VSDESDHVWSHDEVFALLGSSRQAIYSRSIMDGDSDEECQSYGCFEPFAAKRLLKRFEEEGVRFQISSAGGPSLGRGYTQLRREDEIEMA
jgi:hypothetical protein